MLLTPGHACRVHDLTRARREGHGLYADCQSGTVTWLDSISGTTSPLSVRTYLTSLWPAFCVSCQRDTARICCWAPCCGRRCRSISSARTALSSKPAASHAAAAVEWWDRPTDGRTDARPFRRSRSACCAETFLLRAVSVCYHPLTLSLQA